MEKYLIFLIIAFFVVLLILMIFMGVVLFLLLKQKGAVQTKESEKGISELIDTIKDGFESQADLSKGHFCRRHPGIKAAGSCAICGELFCEDCLMEYEKTLFCPEHFRLFTDNKWDEVETVKTTPNNPEEGIYLYDFKKKLWENNMTPTYIVTHYKIDVDNDHIESHVQLLGKRDEVGSLQSELSKFKIDLRNKELNTQKNKKRH